MYGSAMWLGVLRIRSLYQVVNLQRRQHGGSGTTFADTPLRIRLHSGDSK